MFITEVVCIAYINLYFVALSISQSLYLHRKTDTAGPRSIRLALPKAMLHDFGIPLLDSAGFTQRSGSTMRTHSEANIPLEYDETTSHKTDT